MDVLIVVGIIGLSGLAIWRFVKRTEVREKVVYVPPRTPSPMPTIFFVPSPQPVEREMYDPYALDYEFAKMYLINEAEELAGQLVDDPECNHE
jgi:hypothetical protein